jgi:DNA-binding transcriptional ArsR family regulator
MERAHGFIKHATKFLVAATLNTGYTRARKTLTSSDTCNNLLTHVWRRLLLAKSGERLLAQLSALASAPRLRIIALLSSKGRTYVSQLAREIGISRPLLHLHLQKLEAAGLVASKLELSADGKALNFFEVAKFDIELTPAMIVKAAASLPDSDAQED